MKFERSWHHFWGRGPIPPIHLAISFLVGIGALPVATGESAIEADTRDRVGVLLVSHGSRSKVWRDMLSTVGETVARELQGEASIARVRSAFMEYTEPSIATQLKAFDADRIRHVVVVPILLAVSSHSFDDIPVIAGQRDDKAAFDRLALEKIEVYRPKAAIRFAPLLDYPRVLESNVVRRVQQMSRNSTGEGVVLVAYGDKDYNDEWEDVLRRVGGALSNRVGITTWTRSWCGHIAHYKSEPTEQAIRTILEAKDRALVVPVLVAVDDAFQGRIIGGAILAVGKPERIEYRHDAVLPDENVNRWLVDIAREYAQKCVN